MYYSNQNQYFLHGLAAAHRGHLDEDWLANTADPTPVFSALVAVTDRYFHEYLFYVYYILIFGLYCGTLLGVFDVLTEGKAARTARMAFLTALVAVHAGLFRMLSVRAFGIDYPWYFQSGLAAQYVLGFGLQPSVAGVFLLTAILAFLRDRPFAAAACVGLAAALHATYLLPGAILTASFLYVLWHDGRWRRGIATGGLALLIVSPVVVHSFVRFGPTSAETFAEAQRLLARFRIPHHTSPRAWFDHIAMLQMCWIAFAVWLSRGHRLFGVLIAAIVLSFGLTVIQLAIRSDTVALLFPWRTSAVLVPLSTAIILTRGIQTIRPHLARLLPNQRAAIRLACAIVLAGLVAGGVAVNVFGWGYFTNTDELPLLRFVKANARSGEVYLLPVDVPKLGAGRRGAFSTNFTPPPRSGKTPNDIAVDLQRFRLYTGAPIFVDFKAVPYKDVEVLEWHRRLMWAAKAYQSRNWDEGDFLAEAVREGITHVVTTTDRDIRCRRFETVYEDRFYRFYHILGEAP
jgi:hypothetical protein